MDIKFKYFSCKKGHVVPRFGTSSYIGTTRQVGGFTWDESKIVAIPESEFTKYLREYRRAIKDGALIKRKESDYESWIKSQEHKKEDTAKPADNSKVKLDKDASFDKPKVSKRRRKAGKK